jgi:hypothetical protein
MSDPRVKKLRSDASLDAHTNRSGRYGFLKVRLDAVDVEKVWDVLEKSLVIGDGRTNPERLHRALDEVDSNLRRAGMLLQAASEDLAEFELDYRVAFSEWSKNAREALEKAKKDGRQSGQVTQEMVENWIAAHIPEYRRWAKARIDYERNKTMAKHMFQAWESRSASLRAQKDLVLSRRGVDPNMLPRREHKEEDNGK